MTDYTSMRLCAQRAPWRHQTEFFLVEERAVEDYHYTQPHLLQPTDDPARMVWERQKEGFIPPRPSFSLNDANSQELFEMLWSAGFKPTSAVNEAARIDAVSKHLEDMRAIVFDRLKVSAPNQR